MKNKNSAVKGKIKPDVKYNNKLVSKFINMIMSNGKKSLAQDIVYDVFGIIKKQTQKNELEVFQIAIDNIKPKVEVKSRRIGGANYQVPVEVNDIRGTTLALRWIKEFARQKKGKSITSKLVNEILAAYNMEGDAVKKKQITHKMAEANKAFAHYNW